MLLLLFLPRLGAFHFTVTIMSVLVMSGRSVRWLRRMLPPGE